MVFDMEHREIDEVSGAGREILKDEAMNGHTFFNTDEAVLKLLYKVAVDRQRQTGERTVISCSATSLNCCIIPVKKSPAVGKGFLM